MIQIVQKPKPCVSLNNCLYNLTRSTSCTLTAALSPSLFSALLGCHDTAHSSARNVLLLWLCPQIQSTSSFKVQPKSASSLDYLPTERERPVSLNHSSEMPYSLTMPPLSDLPRPGANLLILLSHHRRTVPWAYTVLEIHLLIIWYSI